MFLYNPNLSFNLIVLLISQWSRTYWLLIFIILICEILKYLCKYDELFYACTMHALLNMFFNYWYEIGVAPPPPPFQWLEDHNYICLSVFPYSEELRFLFLFQFQIHWAISKTVNFTQFILVFYIIYFFFSQNALFYFQCNKHYLLFFIYHIDLNFTI